MFSLAQKDEGLQCLIDAFRTPVSVMTKQDLPEMNLLVHGNLPEAIRKHLPIFGTDKETSSGFTTYNSGGRGLLLSDGEKHYRIKGCDVDGSLTKIVGNSSKNHINDVRRSLEKSEPSVPDPFQRLRINWDYHLPFHDDKPFSFFLEDSVQREKETSEIIADSFVSDGFIAPYRFAASVEYPNIKWNGTSTHSLVFELPSMESDFRFGELFRFNFLRLKFASHDELEWIEPLLQDLSKKLTTWHGYMTGVMEDHHLVPTESSHQHHNYVLCQVSDTEMGAARIDHTSTERNPDLSGSYVERMKRELNFFGGQMTDLVCALAIAREGMPFPEERYTGYFDFAVKIPGLDLSSVPGFNEAFQEMKDAFSLGYERRSPIPIPQKEMLDYMKAMGSIEMDLDRQVAVTRFQNEHLTVPGEPTYTPFFPSADTRMLLES